MTIHKALVFPAALLISAAQATEPAAPQEGPAAWIGVGVAGSLASSLSTLHMLWGPGAGILGFSLTVTIAEAIKHYRKQALLDQIEVYREEIRSQLEASPGTEPQRSPGLDLLVEDTRALLDAKSQPSDRELMFALYWVE